LLVDDHTVPGGEGWVQFEMFFCMQDFFVRCARGNDVKLKRSNLHNDRRQRRTEREFSNVTSKKRGAGPLFTRLTDQSQIPKLNSKTCVNGLSPLWTVILM
jgi:hypothetical protein